MTTITWRSQRKMPKTITFLFLLVWTGEASGQICPVQNIHFELVTGKVFTAPNEMLDSRPGTLMLTDCVELCRQNTTCRSANFETGLCVLFSSSSYEYPGGLTSSEFPVFTLYIQKICLPTAPRCNRAWTFESVQGFSMDKFSRKRGQVANREQCMALCTNTKEFPCRSATYTASTGDCRLADMDRHTVAGTGAFRETPGQEYLENNCVDDPVKLCDFQLLENRIMKTVDSVYQDVPTMEACRDLCLTAPYRCHSFDYGDTGDRVCRLSHHTSTSLTHIQDPFLVIGDVHGTYELSSCYNVTIDCRASDMVATITTNKIFTGKIYAKDNPNSCLVDVEGAIEFSISMAYNDLECDVKRESLGVYTSQVIIQHHDSIVTSADLGLALHCQYDLGNKTVSNGLDLEVKGEIEPSLLEESIVESPNVVMSVSARSGAEITAAQVGDPLQLSFQIIDPESPYEIFVRELVAKDGNDQTEIVLLDSNGCPTEGQIMGPLTKGKNYEKLLLANFDAFKFPTSEIVQFRALVTPCMPRCQPVECVYQDFYGGDNTRVTSYGRKRREVSDGRGQELLVTQNFLVVDKFNRSKAGKKSPSGKPGTTFSSSQSLNFDSAVDVERTGDWDPASLEVCLDVTGLCIGVAVFLVAQLVIVFTWTHLWQRRRSKQSVQG